jgi:hypothetical protein
MPCGISCVASDICAPGGGCLRCSISKHMLLLPLLLLLLLAPDALKLDH